MKERDAGSVGEPDVAGWWVRGAAEGPDRPAAAEGVPGGRSPPLTGAAGRARDRGVAREDAVDVGVGQATMEVPLATVEAEVHIKLLPPGEPLDAGEDPAVRPIMVDRDRALPLAERLAIGTGAAAVDARPAQAGGVVRVELGAELPEEPAQRLDVGRRSRSRAVRSTSPIVDTRRVSMATLAARSRSNTRTNTWPPPSGCPLIDPAPMFASWTPRAPSRCSHSRQVS